MHSMIEHTLRQFLLEKISRTQCVVDVMNHVGVCVVAGNIRRSAQIALGMGHPRSLHK
jgi:ribonucleoside-triphosphate reductase (thioredoxin)